MKPSSRLRCDKWVTICVVQKLVDAVSVNTLATHTASLTSTRRGGQSAARYERINDEKRNTYLSDVTNSMKQLKKIIVLGPGEIKRLLQSDAIKGVYTISDITRTTIIETAKQWWRGNKREGRSFSQ